MVVRMYAPLLHADLNRICAIEEDVRHNVSYRCRALRRVDKINVPGHKTSKNC